MRVVSHRGGGPDYRVTEARGLRLVRRVSGRVAPGFLDDLRISLKDGLFRPLPVRERKIPKPGGSGKLRSLGIPTEAA